MIRASILALALINFVPRRRRSQKRIKNKKKRLRKQAELANDGSQQLDNATDLLEGDGSINIPEADSGVIRAQLESEWKGWETSTYPGLIQF